MHRIACVIALLCASNAHALEVRVGHYIDTLSVGCAGAWQAQGSEGLHYCWSEVTDAPVWTDFSKLGADPHAFERMPAEMVELEVAIDAPVAPAPEPSTWAALAGGLLLLAAWRRRTHGVSAS